MALPGASFVVNGARQASESALVTGRTLFVKVTAVDGLNRSVSALTSLMVDLTPPVMGNLTMTYLPQRDAQTYLSNVSIDLVGAAYDDESNVTLSWNTTATDGGAPPTCTLSTRR